MELPNDIWDLLGDLLDNDDDEEDREKEPASRMGFEHRLAIRLAELNAQTSAPTSVEPTLPVAPQPPQPAAPPSRGFGRKGLS